MVPGSTLHGLKENYDFTVHRLSVEYPVGKLYLLEQKHPQQAKLQAIDTLKQELVNVFRPNGKD